MYLNYINLVLKLYGKSLRCSTLAEYLQKFSELLRNNIRNEELLLIANGCELYDNGREQFNKELRIFLSAYEKYVESYKYEHLERGDDISNKINEVVDFFIALKNKNEREFKKSV